MLHGIKWVPNVTAAFLVLACFGFSACKTTHGSTLKEDYIAAGAREFWVSGSDTVTLEPEYAAKTEEQRLSRASFLANARRMAVAWILNAYLADKEAEDSNLHWGKFNAQVRFGSEGQKTDVVKQNGLIYSFNFKFNVAGYSDLIERIMADQGASPASRQFSLPMPNLNNALMSQLKLHNEWFRDDPWEFWDPSRTPANEQRILGLTIEPQKVNSDAFFPFDQLVASGRLPISVHFGWDGENPGKRNDIVLAEVMFKKLVAMGFKAPASDFSTYQPYKSGTLPFRKSIVVNDREVSVEVSVYFGGQFADGVRVAGPDITTDAGGKEVAATMKRSLAANRVVIYIGHSGVRRGFNLADWNKTDEGNVPPTELATLPMMDSYQLVVAEGCQTYYLADSFWQNPAKRNRKNFALISSLGFTSSDSITTATRLIKAFTTQKMNGGKPAMTTPRVSTVLAALNKDYKDPFAYNKPAASTSPRLALTTIDGDDPLFPVYGLHGIEEMPHYDPLANLASICRPCSAGVSCGGDGNICLAGRGDYCTVACTDDAGCSFPTLTKFSCLKPVGAKAGDAGECMPVRGSCAASR